MADLSPAEALLTRPAPGVWLDAAARELVLTEIALLRHELREATRAHLTQQAELAEWERTVVGLRGEAERLTKALEIERFEHRALREGPMKDLPVSAVNGDTPPSQEATDAGDILSAEEDASTEAWLAYLEEEEAGRFAATVYDLPAPAAKPLSLDSGDPSPKWGRASGPVAAWHLWGSTDATEALCGETIDGAVLWLNAGDPFDRERVCLDCHPLAQAPSGEATRAEASTGTQDAPTPHPGRCNARNRRGGALCTRPAKANGRCGRHPLREGEAQANA